MDTIILGENKDISFYNCQIQSLGTGKDCSITFNGVPIGDLALGSDCSINFNNCPIGSVIDSDLDEAEERLEELEDRLDDLNSKSMTWIQELNHRLISVFPCGRLRLR